MTVRLPFQLPLVILRAVFGLEQSATHTRLRELLGEVFAFSESPLSVLPALRRWLRWTPTQRRFNTLMAETDELIFAMFAQRRAAGAGGGPARESGGARPRERRGHLLHPAVGSPRG